MQAGRLLSGLLVALAVATAGCVNAVTDDGVDAESVDAGVKDAEAIATDVLDGVVSVGAATPVASLNFGGTFSFPFDVSDNLTGVVLELEWSAETPASENLDLWVREAGAGSIPPSDPSDFPPPAPLAKATGPSVLRLALTADDLGELSAVDLIVRAPSDMGSGVAFEQPFTLHVTTFEDVAFDSEYSALG